MLIKRNNMGEVLKLIDSLNDKVFNINTQYKLIKIKKKLLEEQEIYDEQIESLKVFCKTDNNGNYLRADDGAFIIKPELEVECHKKLKEINELKVQVPDIYFSLEELEPFNLTLKNLESLEPFIRT